jgi:hypothetical protein
MTIVTYLVLNSDICFGASPTDAGPERTDVMRIS